MANFSAFIRRSNVFDGFDFDKGAPTLLLRLLVFHFFRSFFFCCLLKDWPEMLAEFSTLCYELLAERIPSRGSRAKLPSKGAKNFRQLSPDHPWVLTGHLLDCLLDFFWLFSPFPFIFGFVITRRRRRAAAHMRNVYQMFRPCSLSRDATRSEPEVLQCKNFSLSFDFDLRHVVFINSTP